MGADGTAVAVFGATGCTGRVIVQKPAEILISSRALLVKKGVNVHIPPH